MIYGYQEEEGFLFLCLQPNNYMRRPVVSIIIATHNSEKVIKFPFESVKNQTCPKSYYEVIIGDNESSDNTIEIAKRYGVKVVKVLGKPPQICNQQNSAARKAKGKYIFTLDHDIEVSKNFIRNFVERVKGKGKDVDGWFVPYKIIASSPLLTKVRNFEESYYKNSVVAAVRIVKRSIYWKTEKQHDPAIICGPADWDFDLQLMKIGAKTSWFDDYVYHHEENLSFFKFVTKKIIYSESGEVYKKKWMKKDRKIYKTIVRKQYDPYYRLFGIFIEKGKWKKLIKNLHLYMLFLLVKVATAIVYFSYLQNLRIKNMLQRTK